MGVYCSVLSRSIDADREAAAAVPQMTNQAGNRIERVVPYRV